ncbi:Transcription factor TFIIIB component B'' [Gracilaria domingensis]|nr:Transcription factor TFIIIB component B'' [Gracilaria domingensis]
MSEVPFTDEDDDDTTTTLRHADSVGLANNGQITINDVIRNIRKRKNRKQMPSTARRNEQRRQRRRTHLQNPQPPESEQQPPTATSPSPSPEEETETPPTDVVAPQLTLDEDGNIVVDSASLVVSAGTVTNAEAEGGDVTTFENHEYTKHITSATFSKRKNSSKWLAEETERFYQCLRKYGTDFLLMESDFPRRSRKQLKLKFKREEKDNPRRVDRALRATPLPLPTALPKRPTQSDNQQTKATSRPEPDAPQPTVSGTPAEHRQQDTAQPTTSQQRANESTLKAQANDASDTELKDDENSYNNEATREAVVKVIGTADDDPEMQDVDLHTIQLVADDSDDSWGDSE